ncbi:hypothetical protein [Prevotella sp. oral taxon 299]|uniref:hypothetical protein n=1 Tax=Prevotella sp. oral taxon 299 TaxID=652716 RepID=UPI000309D09B|nr:hypothetical protein [Prevotella sp. oral taxon 299]EFC70921.2 hypothetical protein HMPREF0669_00626 [Prevotella sp. oral taxon 299 str. F0039]
MKKFIYTILSLCAVVSLASCETGDILNLVTQDIDLNENSSEYQEYLKERIDTYLATYRFEEAKRSIAKITDAAIKKDIWLKFNRYYQEALTQGCGYILESGDTLFLKVKNDDNIASNQLKSLSGFYDYVGLKSTNKDVTLWGLANFPSLETLSFPSCFVSKVQDLDKLTKLKVFSFEANKEKYDWWFTNKPFKPVDMAGYDLSKNNQLETLSFKGADLTNLKVPATTLQSLSLKNGVYTNTNLNNIHAKVIDIESSDAADEQLILNNKALQALSISTNTTENKAFKLLNVANTSLHKLNVVENADEAHSLKKIILNDKIDTLTLAGYLNKIVSLHESVELEGLSKLNKLRYFAYNPDFSAVATKDLPKNIEYLEIDGSGNVPYKDNDSFDYSHLTKLKVYSNGKFLSANMKFPEQLDSIHLFPSMAFGDIKIIDFSSTKLTAGYVYIGQLEKNGEAIPMFKKMIFPATLKRIELSNLKTEVLDLSRCTQLETLSINDTGFKDLHIKKIILPKNLKKSQFVGEYSISVQNISNDTVIENKPSWLVSDGNGNYIVSED